MTIHFKDLIPEWDNTGLINHDITSMRRRYWTLRISDRGKDKITHYKTFQRVSLWNKSNAHRELLNKLHKLDIETDNSFDDYHTLVFDNYSAKKKIKFPHQQ